ncbi:MAG: hypothetical protein ABI168_10515 [Ginsengibacter sp.]
MKKFLSFFIGASIFLTFGFTDKSMSPPPNVVEVFTQTFKNPTDLKWFTNGDEFTARFFDNDIRTIITYNKNADFIFSRRYYREDNLPLNILFKIKEKYKDQTIEIVTEIIQSGTILYSVNLEDKKNFYVVESDGNANINLHSKYKKQ